MTTIRFNRKFMKERRMSIKMTRRKMANMLGVSPPTVQYWETGRMIPEPYRHEAIALILQCHVSELFITDGNTPKHGESGIVMLPVKVIFEHSDKIVTALDKDGKSLYYRSGLLCIVMNDQAFEYKNQPVLPIAQPYPENVKK
jgi:DNA-binding XRE family transcriptional regulator